MSQIVKTSGGLKKSSLMKSKSGKIVSSKKSAFGKKIYAKYLSKWTAAVVKARKALGVKGFVPVKKARAPALRIDNSALCDGVSSRKKYVKNIF